MIHSGFTGTAYREGACIHIGDIIELLGGQCEGGKNPGRRNLKVMCASMTRASPRYFSDANMEISWLFLNRGKITAVTLSLVCLIGRTSFIVVLHHQAQNQKE